MLVERFANAEAVASAEKGREDDDLDRVRDARDRLEQASLPLASVLMDEVVQQTVTGKRLEDV